MGSISDTARTTTLARVVAFGGVLVGVVVLWEAYKLLGAVTGGVWPLTDIEMRPRPGNNAMPHVWDMIGALARPVRRGGEPLFLALTVATLYTLREALVGFMVGAVVGFGIGAVFVRSLTAERAFMPFVVASQTIPIIAIAPLVVIWGRRLGLPAWLAVSVIAAFLTFFPVAINTVRGLRSPDATATELFRSYAASPGQRLWKLQVPSALPYLFTAFKISAAASVVGAIVGELPTGSRSGLGRELLFFNQVFASDPSKLYATVLMSAIGGIVFVGAIALAERVTLPRPRPEAGA